jgi:hypothetical protein
MTATFSLVLLVSSKERNNCANDFINFPPISK